MSKRGRSTRLSPPRPREETSISSSVMSSESSTSSPAWVQSMESSCVSSSECEEETRAMLLVGCPRCLMYVMLSDVDPKCPKCKSTVLLDFLNNLQNNTKKE